MKSYSTSRIYSGIIKPAFDFCTALILLLPALPIIIISALLLACQNRGQIFFKQSRPGINGQIFNIIKFRTMNDRRDSSGALLPDPKRLTYWGRIIRSLSIDELPQLFNVLTGDMSLIGPRPLLPEYLPLYSERQKRRHNVKPGITGWAQVNGRNAISWEEKFEYDVWYSENISFALDMKIFFLTIKKILLKEGISSSTSETMEKFTGNR